MYITCLLNLNPTHDFLFFLFMHGTSAFNISDKGVVLGMTILEIILEVLFLVDILLQFNLTYHDEVTKVGG